MSETLFGNADAIAKGEVVPTENVDCPVCGIPPVPFAVDYQGFRLCRCPECSLEFLSPRLDYQQLAENVYSHNYFAEEGEVMVIPPERMHYFRRQLADFEKLKPDHGRLLDLGCGNCDFLDAARDAGWDVAGVDIKLTSRTRNYDATIWEGALDEIDFGEERFDLIRLNHVLEHMQDPVASLALLRGLLRPGGILYVSVPNIAGISPRIKSFQSRYNLKAHKWRHYAAVHHLFFFTQKTLQLVHEKAGFHVLDWSTPEPLRGRQGPLGHKIARAFYEKPRISSILDMYSTPAE